MREIKFRAWVNGQMISWEEMVKDKYFVDFFTMLRPMNPPKRVAELMQYTGLKDKNGKEIYEGDIIEYMIYDAEAGISYTYIEEVQFKDGCFDLDNCPVSIIVDGDDNIGEVIGNIYENPELL